MTKRLKRIRAVIGLGLTWAAAWALFGVLIGVASLLLPGLPWNSFFEIFDAPLPALAIPGFLGGALFSTVLGIVGRGRRFDELSVPRFAAWGALAGLLVSLIPAAAVVLGLATIGRPDAGLWQVTGVISGPLTFLTALSAAGSLLLARRAEDRELSEPGLDMVEAEIAGGRTPQMLEDRNWSLDAHPVARSGERARPTPADQPSDA